MQVIIQARMTSTRLPGKIIEKIGSKSALEHVQARAVMSNAHEVTIAVPSLEDARAIKDAGHVGSFYVHDGDENDVLGRLHAAATGDVIVRLTADTPLLPWTAISQCTSLLMYRGAGYDYVETRSDPSTRPNGLDVQCFLRELLQRAHESTTDAHAREHITPALYAQAMYPARCRDIEGIPLDSLPPWRLTLDTQDDLDWMRSLCEAGLSLAPTKITLRALMKFFVAHPELQRYDISGYKHHTEWHRLLPQEIF